MIVMHVMLPSSKSQKWKKMEKPVSFQGNKKQQGDVL